jgi:nucleoside-diphosphate-sugar epimerase
VNRVLVTGASGFIGRRTLLRLAEDGFEVHAVARSINERDDWVEWHQADLLSPTSAETLIEEIAPTHLLHFAWCAEPGTYWSSPDNLRWLEASLRLLQPFAAGGRRAVVAGTCAEYDWSYGLCSEQVTPLRPNSLYGTCKHALHLVIERVAGETGLSTAWGRIFFVYGPDEHPNRFVASIIQSLLRGEPAPATSGMQIRDYLHVDDVAGAFVRLLQSDIVGALNIGSGEPLRVRDLLFAIGEAVGARDLLRLGALRMRPDEPPLLVADTRRLTHELRWAPRFSLEDGISDTVSWWRGNIESVVA